MHRDRFLRTVVAIALISSPLFAAVEIAPVRVGPTDGETAITAIGDQFIVTWRRDTDLFASRIRRDGTVADEVGIPIARNVGPHDFASLESLHLATWPTVAGASAGIVSRDLSLLWTDSLTTANTPCTTFARASASRLLAVAHCAPQLSLRLYDSSGNTLLWRHEIHDEIGAISAIAADDNGFLVIARSIAFGKPTLATRIGNDGTRTGWSTLAPVVQPSEVSLVWTGTRHLLLWNSFQDGSIRAIWLDRNGTPLTPGFDLVPNHFAVEAIGTGGGRVSVILRPRPTAGSAGTIQSLIDGTSVVTTTIGPLQSIRDYHQANGQLLILWATEQHSIPRLRLSWGAGMRGRLVLDPLDLGLEGFELIAARSATSQGSSSIAVGPEQIFASWLESDPARGDVGVFAGRLTHAGAQREAQPIRLDAPGGVPLGTSVDGNDSALIAWIEQEASGRHLRLRAIDRNGQAGERVDVTGLAAGFEPRVVRGATRYLVLWAEERFDGSARLMGVRTNLGGRPVEPPVDLGSIVAATTMADAAWDGERFVVVHEERDVAGRSRIVARDVREDGFIGSPVVLSDPSRDAFRPAIGINRSRLLIVWRESDGLHARALEEAPLSRRRRGVVPSMRLDRLVVPAADLGRTPSDVAYSVAAHRGGFAIALARLTAEKPEAVLARVDVTDGIPRAGAVSPIATLVDLVIDTASHNGTTWVTWTDWRFTVPWSGASRSFLMSY